MEMMDSAITDSKYYKLSSTPCFKVVDRMILASASPRRRELLAALGLQFIVNIPEIDETINEGEEPNAFVLRMAKEKAEWIAKKYTDVWILSADTIVVSGREILGKPEDPLQALNILKRLSGRKHEVWTGYCIHNGQTQQQVVNAVKTEVEFIEADAELLKAYVLTGEPLDKAGAYGIQGIGGFLVKRISGSYSNVVGLPLAEVTVDLQRMGIIVPEMEDI